MIFLPTFLPDHTPICRVLFCSRQHQSDISQRADDAAAGAAPGEGQLQPQPREHEAGHVPSPLLSPPFDFQVEVENFVLRVAAEFSSRKEQLVFLINNYDMMLGVLMVTDAPAFLFPSLENCVPFASFEGRFLLVQWFILEPGTVSG